MTIDSCDANLTPLANDPAPDPPVCANCGHRVDRTDVICPHCGESLAGG